MRLIEGWWSFNDAEQELVRTDGSSVRYKGEDRLQDTSALRRWMVFEAQIPPFRSQDFTVERIDERRMFGGRLGWRAHLPGAAPGQLAELVIDAFAHWPEDTEAGMRPGEVEVRFQGDCPRFLSTGAATLRLQPVPTLEVPTGLSGQDWQWVPPISSACSTPMLPNFQDLRARDVLSFLSEAQERVPHLASPKGRLFPLWLKGGLCHWVYADSDFLTDRIALNLAWKGPTAEWIMSVSTDVLVGTRVLPRGDLAVLNDGPIRAPRRMAQGLGDERSSLPLELLKRIHDAMVESAFLWKDCAFSLPDVQGEVRTIELLNPIELVSRWAPGPIGRPYEIRETRAPKSDRVVTSSYDDGRIVIDSDPPSVRDNHEARSLEFESSVSGCGAAETAQTFRLAYEDAAGSTDVLVSRRPRETPWRTLEWIADLRVGAFNTFDEVRWRAARQFIAGAICHWPDCEQTGPAPPGVRLIGANIDGNWDPHVGETVWAAHLSNPPPQSQRASGDGEAPRRWQQIKKVNPSAPLDLPAEDGQPLPPFDLSQWLVEFPDRSAWVRDDGKAIYSFAGTSPRQGHGGGSSYYDYRDEDVWIRLSVQKNYGWTSIVAAGPVQQSRRSLTDFVQRTQPNPFLQPALWSRLREVKEAMFATHRQSVISISGVRFADRLLVGGSKLYDASAGELGNYLSNLPL